MFNLEGKKALVIGGSRGIGKTITSALAENGANTIFTYNKNIDASEKLKVEISEKKYSCKYFQLDISDPKKVKSFFEEFHFELNGLDVLVNCAGINKPTDFDKVSLEDWDNIIDTNLRGPFLCIQNSIKLLNENASIINIGSVSGQYGGPRTPHYAVSKAGLISLSQVAARFLSPKNIRCNTISAGLIQSEMAQAGLANPAVKAQTENIILKRLGFTKEVASVVLFLASEKSSYITAQTINVNGGLYF